MYRCFYRDFCRCARALRLVAALAVSGLFLGLLSACAPLFVGGTAVTAAVVASDRRTAGEQVEDQVIELKVASDMRALFAQEKRVRINATSYAGVLLLTGDVPTQADSTRAQKAAGQVERVVRVINRLRVGDVTSLGVRSSDTWLASKVRTNLINTKDVPSSTIVITVERGTVYLMGRVTRDEADRAARTVAALNGINQVVTLFDIVPDAVRERPASQPAQNAAAPAVVATTTTTTTSTPFSAASGNVQTMPVR